MYLKRLVRHRFLPTNCSWFIVHWTINRSLWNDQVSHRWHSYCLLTLLQTESISHQFPHRGCHYTAINLNWWNGTHRSVKLSNHSQSFSRTIKIDGVARVTAIPTDGLTINSPMPSSGTVLTTHTASKIFAVSVRTSTIFRGISSIILNDYIW